MTFKTLLQRNSWLSVASILLELYPDEAKNISGYQGVFEKLLFMNAEDPEMTIEVVRQKDEFDGEEYIDVSGKYKYPKNKDEKFSQAIEFTAWNNWLGMEISQESSRVFTDLEIISHCLFEMTFVGFEEGDIQKELNGIQKSAEDYKNMTSEEKQENTTSLEDFLGDLQNENDEGKQ